MMHVPVDSLRAGPGGMRARLAFLFCFAAAATHGQGGGANGQGGYAPNMSNIRTPGYRQDYPHRQIYGMDGLPAQDYSAEQLVPTQAARTSPPDCVGGRRSAGFRSNLGATNAHAQGRRRAREAALAPRMRTHGGRLRAARRGRRRGVGGPGGEEAHAPVRLGSTAPRCNPARAARPCHRSGDAGTPGCSQACEYCSCWRRILPARWRLLPARRPQRPGRTERRAGPAFRLDRHAGRPEEPACWQQGQSFIFLEFYWSSTYVRRCVRYYSDVTSLQ
jgi:hypothetical protein